MFDQTSPTLTAPPGPEATQQIASAYETALLAISLGQLARLPDRATRTTLVSAIIAEGRRTGFEPGRMVDAGLAAVRLWS